MMSIVISQRRAWRQNLMRVVVAMALTLAAITPALAAPTYYTVTSASASSTYSGWPVTSLYDASKTTCWSSNTHSSAQFTEWAAFWWASFQNVNCVTLSPRLIGGVGQCFPVEFTVSWTDGSTWHAARGLTHYTNPTTQDVTIVLPETVNTNGIYLVASVLGKDTGSSYAFQLGDAKAGYDPALSDTPYSTNSASASSTIAGWPASSTYDGNNATCWSSNTHSSAGYTEWLAAWWSQGYQNINYVKVRPRYNASNQAQGFPVNFTVAYSSTAPAWVTAVTYTSYPKPTRGDWIILPLPSTVYGNGVMITATTLGRDDAGNYVFQLAEVKAGYDPGFNQFQFVSNNTPALPSRNQIGNVGSQAIDRANQLGSWNYDDRGILIYPGAGTIQNLYAPNAVYMGGTSWNLYFGGEDGAPTPDEDRIYRTTTSDNFLSFGAHSLMIDRGVFWDVNNESVVKLSANSWRMAYTTWAGGSTLNRTGYATSTDGINWTPAAGSSSYLVNVTGYSNWTYGDFNGSNVIYKDSAGTWHLFFQDWDTNHTHAYSVQHATGTDGVNFTWQSAVTDSTMAINDLKPFTYGGATYYIGAYHGNTQNIWTSVSTSPAWLDPISVAFTNRGSADYYMATCGLVSDGSRLYGMLYGATVTWGPTMRIYARWLQKKVVFQNAYVRWGDTENSYGPDNARLIQDTANQVETGNFYVYDTDGATLLYKSPLVTMREGDIWNYNPSFSPGY